MSMNRPEPLGRSAPFLEPLARPETVKPIVEEPYEVGGPEQSSLDDERWWPFGLVEWFAIAQTALPALLFVPGTQSLRGAIRASAFLISLVGFAVWYFRPGERKPVRHPAARWLMLVLACLAAMILHPDTDSVTAGVAQTALYVAVFCPLLWVPAFVTGRHQVIRVLAILLVCNGINSAVGVLQVYDPARWMPAEFSSTFALNRDILAGSTYEGPNGRRIVRPPGLYDTPGAVCGAGTVAALLGLIFSLEKMRWWKRAIALALSAAGMAAIYLSHVRASAVVTAGMLITYLLMLVFQNQKKRASGFVVFAVGLSVLAFLVATILGGQGIRDRFLSLFESDPGNVYYQSRGVMLEHAFTDLLFEYPLGAGLARWGMMASYVGMPRSKQIWAEIQPTAWILDGGLFLLILYGGALVATVLWEWRVVRDLPDPNDRLWSSAVIAANVGTLALVATFVPFATQIGTQFWFLEGLLYGAMASKLQRR